MGHIAGMRSRGLPAGLTLNAQKETWLLEAGPLRVRDEAGNGVLAASALVRRTYESGASQRISDSRGSCRIKNYPTSGAFFLVFQAMTRSAFGTDWNLTHSRSPTYSPSSWNATGRADLTVNSPSSCRVRTLRPCGVLAARDSI